MVNFKVAERIIPEDFDNFKGMCKNLSKQLLSDFDEISSLGTSRMLDARYDRFRRIGIYAEAEETNE